MPERNGLASLLRRPVYVTEPVTLTVPYAPAAAWIDAIGSDPRTAAVRLAEESRTVILQMARGRIPMADVESATHTVLEELTGLKWWTALKLVYASASGALLGELTLHGVDPERVSLGQWCQAALQLLLRDADRKQRDAVLFQLELPPPGYESAWDDDVEYYNRMAADARRMHGTPEVIPGGQ